MSILLKEDSIDGETLCAPFTDALSNEKKTPYISDEDWEEILGLSPALNNLFSISIPAAKLRSEPLGSILAIDDDSKLFDYISQKVAIEMGNAMRIANIENCLKKPDLVGLLTNLSELDILALYGNLKKLDYELQDLLYSAINNNEIDVSIGKSPSANSIHFDLPHVTYMFRTSSNSCVPPKLYDSIEIIIDCNDIPKEAIYKAEIRSLCDKYFLIISEEILLRLSRTVTTSQYTSQSLMRFLSNYMCVNHLGNIVTTEIVDEAIGIINSPKTYGELTISDIDSFSVKEFDDFARELLSRMGYISSDINQNDRHCSLFTVDQHGIKMGIEVIHAADETVGVSAVTNLSSYVKKMDLDKGVIISRKVFTTQSLKLAHNTHITLWDRNDLISLLAEYFKD